MRVIRQGSRGGPSGRVAHRVGGATMARHSPFVIVLSDEGRDALKTVVRERTAEHRVVLRAQTVLAAADGEENLSIADRLEVAPNTVIKWRKRFFDEGVDVRGSET